MVTNPTIQNLLQKLADEEVKHVEWFSELKRKVKSKDDPRIEELGKSILRDVLGNQSFSLEELDFSKIDQIDDLLKLAIEFERDTVLFYEMVRSLIDDVEVLQALDTIIKEENQHIQLFQAMMDSGSSEI
jgi:rubrerythrin